MNALLDAIAARLRADTQLAEIMGARPTVWRRPPPDAPLPYITLRTAGGLPFDTMDTTGDRVTVRAAVWWSAASRSPGALGAAQAEEARARIQALIDRYPFQLAVGRLVGIERTASFELPDPDGSTEQVGVQFLATLENN